MTSWTDAAARERERLLEEYKRRGREVPADQYAPWQPAELLGRIGRKRVASALLRAAEAFPASGAAALEVGCGQLGWLPDLIEWGIRERNIAGIDLDAGRVASAQQRLPLADLREGDATSLPWDEASFDLVIASTVFSSVLDPIVQHRVATEMWRVLKPGGAVLWYDVAVRNPANAQLTPLRPAMVQGLFPEGQMQCRRVTLLPAIARVVAPRSWLLATVLEAIPLLRTHVLAVIRK